MNKSEIESALRNMRSDIEVRIDRFTMEGSGWAVIRLLNHDLHVNKYDPLAARSYFPLPAEIQNKKATVNIHNKDDKCFIYCLGRDLDLTFEKTNLERVSTHLKTVCESLGLNNIKTPMNEQDLPKIESQFNISINLFSHSNSDIYPIRLTKSTAAKHINLLITSNSETNHYVWIKNFSRLCFNITKHTRCLHNTAPIYLRDLCMPISSLKGRSHLRSAAAGDLRVPSAKTVTIGRRGFSVAGPAAWNNLPTTLKDYTLTFTAFKKLLKTELFMLM